jgi:hypothetical protein
VTDRDQIKRLRIREIGRLIGTNGQVLPSWKKNLAKGGLVGCTFGLIVQRQFPAFQGEPQTPLDGFVIMVGTSTSVLKNR